MSAGAVRIARPEKPEDIRLAREMFLEYAGSLDVSLSFQHFDEEMARFPGEYTPPGGTLLIAWRDGEAIGVVGLRRFDDAYAEMKRLYLRPAARRSGAGRALAETVIGAAISLGYRGIRLDTMPSMQAAIALYHSLGFVTVDGPVIEGGPQLIYMQREFQPTGR